MKKILSAVIVTAAFGAVLADAEPADETIVAASTFEIGTLQITAGIGTNNVVIPVCFKNLAEWNTNSDSLPVAQIMKVSNLNDGDHLIRFNGEKYDGWAWNGEAWVADKNITIGINSPVVEGGSAADTKLVTGEAMWLKRSNASTATTIQLFGKYVAPSNVTQKIARGKGKLTFLANPTCAQVSSDVLKTKLAGVAKKGDKIRKVSGTGTTKDFTYTLNTKTKQYVWAYVKGKTITYGPDALAPYEGLWYISGSDGDDESFTWGN